MHDSIGHKVVNNENENKYRYLKTSGEKSTEHNYLNFFKIVIAII